MPTMKALMAMRPAPGRLQWIGLRSVRRGTIEVVDAAEVVAGRGLVGDHFHDRSTGHGDGKRSVTLIQAEHLVAVGGFLGRGAIDPRLTRRNLVVAGINLLALKQRRFTIGEAEFEMTGDCAPCAHMEEALGAGGFQAMRGHGGITVRVLRGGRIAVGDAVTCVAESAASNRGASGGLFDDA
jgi:MOSC domain-containing protein YiiM